MHYGSKTGFSEPIKRVIEAVVAEPAEDGQVPKTPTEAVAQVLPKSKFLQNVGFEPVAPKRNAKSAVSACVQELEAEVELEKQGAAALRDELEILKLKAVESEDARQKQREEIEILKKQGEENRKQAEETNSLLRRLLSLKE
ncbi:hypothetical protein HU200_021888 [Digitaria exilis]|uniref:Uncharacterized protein n=1 Tax=Digitaria exilis TaxID=1010633 RepID=A0A835EZ41_9POAL|nr:hypothetical protein HU200_021888 [Digitaria exilis]